MASPPPSDVPRLSAELERAALRAVAACYDDINRTLFDERLRRPALELSDSARRLGQWRGDVRALELSRRMLVEQPWGDLVEVLKHEMAHQYVQEVLRVADESPHGRAYRRVCEERGIDARATGAPSAEPATETEPVLKKISRLLALAESANEHEAQLAMSTAQRLMLKYNLEEVASSTRSYCFRHVGKPTGRVNESQRRLALILSEHFFVEVIWVPVWRPLEGKRGSVIEVCGTPQNVELAEYVYWFLTNTAERLWREHKRGNGIRRNRDRQAFVAGVMTGFAEKLDAQRGESQQHGLVWRGDPELRGYLKSRHRYVRWTSYRTSQRSDAHHHGRAAGRDIVLHRGIREGGGGRPLLLGSGRR